MIKSLEVREFKGHLHSTLEFHKGINVITGASDAGKSTLLKSLLWVLTNRPAWGGLVSFWNRRKNKKGEVVSPIDPINPTFARLKVGKDVITRISDGKRNGYDIPGQEGENGLGAIGTSVPEQVTTLLNMSNLNIAKQFDPPFLIGETPPEVARYLNKLIKLEEIDTVLVATESKKREERKVGAALERAIAELEVSVEAMDWVERAKELESDIERIAEVATTVDNKLSDLYRAIADLAVQDSLLTKKGKVEQGVRLMKAIDASEGLIDEVSEEQVELTRLLTTLDDLEVLLACPIERMNKVLSDIDKIALGIANSIVDSRTLESLREALLKADSGKVDASTLKKANSLVARLDEAIEEEEDTLAILTKLAEYAGLITANEAVIKNNSTKVEVLNAEIPEECPLCGSVIEEGHTHE